MSKEEALTGQAGAGEATNASTKRLTLSVALEDFLKGKGVDSSALLAEPTIRAPPYDGSYPLSAYFISSSHNTYLTDHQLFGKSCASQYTDALARGHRCVETDCWDGDDGEPCIYHGFTLTSKITFREVAEAIGNALKPDDLPIVVSFECHLGIEQQKRAVEIAKEVWKDKLVDAPIGPDNKESIALETARGKILLKVEYCRGLIPALDETLSDLSQSAEDASESSESDEEEKAKESGEDPAALATRKKRKKQPKQRLCKELAELGVYTTSLKPNGDDFLREVPKRHPSLIANISESALGKHTATRLEAVIHHNAHSLMRVYPKGIRINSKNLDPLQWWRAGAQITALNTQKFDRGMQLNEALFAGSHGWLLKPDYLRAKPDGSVPPLPVPVKSRLEIELVGASNLERPEDAKKGLNAYIEIELCTPKDSQRQKSKVVKPDKTDESKGSNPIWHQTLTFDFVRDHWTFVRFLFTHDDSWHSRDDRFAIYSVFLPYVTPGYHVARLLDLSGTITDAAFVFKIDVKDL